MTEKNQKKTIINFYCLSCQRAFDQDVGEVRFDEIDGYPNFEKTIECPTCFSQYSHRSDNFSDHFELTEVGQSQLTEVYMRRM